MHTISHSLARPPLNRPHPLGMAQLAGAAQLHAPTSDTAEGPRDSVTLSPRALAASGQGEQATEPTRMRQALENPELAEKLKAFPPEFQEAVRNISDNQFKVLGKPLSKDNRERFINGKAMGMSIWGRVKKGITQERKEGVITQPEEKGLHGMVDNVAGFKPEQRKVLLELLDGVRTHR